MWGLFFVVIGFLGLFFINLFEDITSTNDQNYYLLKETTQAAMFDSIDLAQFREFGTLRIVKEKFVENFTRRFSESTNIQKNYRIKFLEIIEQPPKVTIEVGSASRVTFTEDDFDINIKNVLDAILETNWIGDEANHPTLKGCRIKYTPAYMFPCKKTMEICEPVYDCSVPWVTKKTYGYMYKLICYPNWSWLGNPIPKPCGPCVAKREDVINYGEKCPSGYTPSTSYVDTCFIKSVKVCNGVMTKIRDDCKTQTINTTCYQSAKYEVVCD